MKISFIGSGYVGLTSGAVFAELSNKVWVVDIDKEKISTIKQGKSPFYEPGLDELITKNVDAGRLIPTTDLKEAVVNSKIIFIAVGTPVGNNEEADLSQVKKVVEDIANNIDDDYKLIVIKSTVPAGTTKLMEKLIKEINPEADFDIGFCPEFLRPGKAVEDTLHPDRVIVGMESGKGFQLFKKLHQPIDGPLVRTSIESAEIIKYAANSFLALRIGFIDQIALLAEKTGADVKEVIKGIGLDKRIGSHYWYPGIGYGGYCFPKDVLALSAAFKKAGIDNDLFAKLNQLNKTRPEIYVNKLKERLSGLEGKTIAVLGLTAKPGSDDMRGSQAVYFILELIKQGAKVKAYDPLGMVNAKKILDNIVYCDNCQNAVKNTDAVCVLCEWKEFEKLNWGEISQLMKGNLVFDAKRMFEPEKIRQTGLEYIGVGIGNSI